MKIYRLLLFALLFSACKTQQCTIHDAQCTVIRDTVMQHDSIYVHEFTQGDTVYVTKYRDRWRDKVVHQTDTVYVAIGDRARDRPKPFYRHCTIGFWILLLLLLGRLAFRIMKAIYLRK